VQREPERPVLLQPGEGETIFDGSDRTIRILADREELTLTWFRYEPGQEGPDPHVHRRHTDAFYVLEGKLELTHAPSPMGFLREILDRPDGERPFPADSSRLSAENAAVPALTKKGFSDGVEFV
jgi:hypothetical protein